MRGWLAILLILAVGCQGDNAMSPSGPGSSNVEVRRIIRGRVISQGTPLAGATIVLDPSSVSTLTDSNGYFSLTVVDPAHGYLLEASANGYISSIVPIEFTTSDSIITLEISLRERQTPRPPVTDGALRATSSYIAGVFGIGETMQFRLSVEYTGDTSIHSIVIRDSLETAFGKITDVLLNPVYASIASVSIEQEKKILEVSIDELSPTTGWIDILEFEVGSPPTAGVYCVYIFSYADTASRSLEDTHVSCVTESTGQ